MRPYKAIWHPAQHERWPLQGAGCCADLAASTSQKDWTQDHTCPTEVCGWRGEVGRKISALACIASSRTAPFDMALQGLMVAYLPQVHTAVKTCLKEIGYRSQTESGRRRHHPSWISTSTSASTRIAGPRHGTFAVLHGHSPWYRLLNIDTFTVMERIRWSRHKQALSHARPHP